MGGTLLSPSYKLGHDNRIKNTSMAIIIGRILVIYANKKSEKYMIYF